jgi:hypothetical protein
MGRLSGCFDLHCIQVSTETTPGWRFLSQMLITVLSLIHPSPRHGHKRFFPLLDFVLHRVKFKNNRINSSRPFGCRLFVSARLLVPVSSFFIYSDSQCFIRLPLSPLLFFKPEIRILNLFPRFPLCRFSALRFALHSLFFMLNSSLDPSHSSREAFRTHFC